ncbi:MAG: S8 family serine peptidase, partial [Acidobacteria bacterium]|nr:S8 family serine peptidase [Candidatus Polarisedimenticola svalbardensis]
MPNFRRIVLPAMLLIPLLVSPVLSASGGGESELSLQPGPGGSVLSMDGNPFHRTGAAVTGERLIMVPGTGTRLALWNETDEVGNGTPFFSIGRAGEEMGPAVRTSYTLKVLHGDFDPSRQVPAVDRFFASGDSENLHIVQFQTQALEEYRDAIRFMGGRLQGFLANHAHVVRMSPGVRDQVAALPFVRWVGPLHPAYRLEAFLRDNRANAGELFPLQRYNILVFEEGEAGLDSVLQRLKSLGDGVEPYPGGKYLATAVLTPAQLYQVARWDEVQYVDRWTAMESDMDIVREIGGANYLETVAGYTGAGVRAEIFDAGFNLAHPDFQSRPLIEHGGAVGNDSHGTATAGVNFGDGTGDARARGIMPDGQGIVADYNNVGLSGPTRYAHTGELLQDPYYAVFQTSSVGDGRTFNYTTISADHDTLLFDWDILHCQSQSNAGNQDSRPQAWAKNVLSGGAFNHYDTLDRSDDCWCNTGSIGPASDGRIKPDLSFFYDDTYTTYSTGSGYGEFGGTSGATPSICGYAGLFFEMWSDGIFGNEVDALGTVFENRPHMTTAKAFLINTADQQPFTGQTHDLTRVHQGWGVPDIENMYDMRDNISFIDETVLLTNMESVEYNALVSAGEPAMRVTLTFADPAGNPASSEHRVNDLTLKVTSPSDIVYWGNNGLLDGNWSTPGGVANTIDTVENVFVENPEEGLWIIEIIASEINQDSHVETSELDADFALVVSGAVMTQCTSEGRLALNGALLACEDESRIRVVDCDLNTDDNTVQTVTVTVASDTELSGETVLLTETGPASATFQNTILVSVTDGAGVLQVTEGDTVTATYIDADDGMGGTGLTRTDTAVVDCSPPVISGVQATGVQPRSAVIEFSTDEPAEGNVRYGLSCGVLDQLKSRAGLVAAHAITLTGLSDNTAYFYAVDVDDAVGNGSSDDNGGICYTFTTPEIPDFFTELFGSDNDTDFLRLSFTPNGSTDFYESCVAPITAFPSDPSGGTALSLTDDSFTTVNLTPGNTVSLYGVAYNTFYVGSNGFITFNSGSSDTSETLGEHFNQPRISALYDDLNPASAGTVSWKELPDRVVVTYEGVPEYSQTNTNDFQIEMFFSGAIAINYLTVDAVDGLAGLSAGGGLSPDYFETDLSGMASCGGEACWDGVLNQDEERIDCGGICQPCQCLSDTECDDGLFCTGTNSCDDYGRCAAGSDPCSGEACHEGGDTCVECLDSAACDDGLFCNGVETCRGNICQAGLDPCPFGLCEEGVDACAVCDNDSVCEPGEDCSNCPGDCISGSIPVCGNGVCEVPDGEDCITCPEDCNGDQKGQPSSQYCCGDGITGTNPVGCADLRCNAGGNTCAVDPILAYCCGDSTCNDIENVGNCPADCTVAVPGEAG